MSAAASAATPPTMTAPVAEAATSTTALVRLIGSPVPRSVTARRSPHMTQNFHSERTSEAHRGQVVIRGS